MENRAHSRRREGRAIRKARREARRFVAEPEEMARLFRNAGVAVEHVAECLADFAQQVEAAFRQFAVVLGGQQGLLGRSGAGTPNHPSEGVSATESVSRPPVTMSDIDAVAEDLGVILTPRQREITESILRGDLGLVVGGRSAGRATLARVLQHAQNRTGHEAPGAWVDETMGFEVPDER